MSITVENGWMDILFDKNIYCIQNVNKLKVEQHPEPDKLSLYIICNQLLDVLCSKTGYIMKEMHFRHWVAIMHFFPARSFDPAWPKTLLKASAGIM